MKRPHPLKYVKFVPTRDGRGWHAYFDTGNKANGKRVYTAMGLWGSPGFFDRYATLQGHRTRKQATESALTVAGLIASYERSQAYSRLAEATKRNYGYSFAKIKALFGDFPIDDLTRRDIQIALRDRIEGNGARNMFIKVIGLLYKWARAEELTEARPAADIALYEMGEHDPWPDDLLAEVLAADDDRIRLAARLLFYTGNRIQDICKLRWSAVERGKIAIKQQKTGTALSIEMHRDLAEELARTPKRGLTILADEQGRPLKVADLRYALQQWAKARGHKVVPHGLRKNAVNELLLAGCSVAEVASITGQTYQVVEDYARKVNRTKLAEAAIIKLERRNKV